jgi:putative acetyltransferase
MHSSCPASATTDTCPAPEIEIVEARTPDQFAAAATLIRAFVAWARVRHAKDAWTIDIYFDPAAFEAELAALKTRYATPHGAILLALADGAPVACVVLDRLEDGICCMRRMFVREAMHGQGIGRRMATSLLDLARARGYRLMRLETSTYLHEAQALYRSLGFRVVPAYEEIPEPLRPFCIFMERPL